MGNIRKPEQEVLFNNKIKEGKDEDKAKVEIKRDMDFIRQKEKENREKKRQIELLKKQTEKESEKLDADFKKAFAELTKVKEKQNQSINLKENLKHTTLNHLKRIILCLEENPDGARKVDIYKFCYSNKQLLKEGLEFMLKHRIIKEEDKGGVSFYKMNDGK